MFSQDSTLHRYGFRWESTNLLLGVASLVGCAGSEVFGAGSTVLLVVALELLRLVVAARLALPWAVEEAVRLNTSFLVESMVSSRLTGLVAIATRVKGWRQRKVIAHASKNSSLILSGCCKLRAIWSPGHAEDGFYMSIRVDIDKGVLVCTYVGENPLICGESCASVEGEGTNGPADHVSSAPGEEFLDSGLSDPREYGELPSKPVP